MTDTLVISQQEELKMYTQYLTVQCSCRFYFEQSGTPLWESQVSQQTDNLMVQMWTNLVRPKTIFLSLLQTLTHTVHTNTQSHCSLKHEDNAFCVFQLQPTSGQLNTDDSGKIIALPCPTEVSCC